MDDKFREQVEREQNILERIVEVIPGYRSYRQRERRREVDKALRTYVANIIRSFMHKLRNLSKPLTNTGRLDLLDDIDNLYRRLETVADKTLLAGYGYSGFFDAVKIKEQELSALYDFDLKLLETVKALDGLLSPDEEKTLSSDSVLLAKRLRVIEKNIRQLESLLVERTNFIVNIKGL